jgi:NADP-dependent 3-hydroxy acid dehydrogenase YdfG
MKTVLITGATSGIGEACARKFAQGDYRLIITGRNSEKLCALQKELEAKGTEVMTLTFDVRDRKAAIEAVKSIPAEWAVIDVLINNAGLALGLDKEHEGSLDDFETMIDTNIKGLLTMTRLIVPSMVERNHGHVINIGSVAGDAAYGGGSVYCGTKAAVKMISDGLRIDVMDSAVRVTTLKPGLVETNFSRTRFKGDEERADKVYEGLQPLTGTDIADTGFYCAEAPEHVQIAEVLILATHQANSSMVSRDTNRNEHLS